jgi:hypothetical protein
MLSHPATKPIPIPAITASFTARMSEARKTMLASGTVSVSQR